VDDGRGGAVRGRGARRLRRRGGEDGHGDRGREVDRAGDRDRRSAVGIGRAAVAEGRGARSGRPFTFRIVELRRSGPTVVLNGTLTVDADADDDVRIADLFGDGQLQELEGRRRNEPADVFDGVAVIDAQNRRKYLVPATPTGAACAATSCQARSPDPASRSASPPRSARRPAA
jgi:hypothetical protein